MSESTKRQLLVYAAVIALASGHTACGGPAFESGEAPSAVGATGGVSSAGTAGASAGTGAAGHGGAPMAPLTLAGAPNAGAAPNMGGALNAGGTFDAGGVSIAGAASNATGGSAAGGGGSAPTTPEGVQLDSTDWQLSASSTYEYDSSPDYVVDDDPYSAWSSGAPQAPGMWFMVDLGEPQFFFEVDTWTDPITNDYAQHLRLSGSIDGSHFTELRGGIEGTRELKIAFKQAKYARYLKLELESDAGGLWWRIDDLSVLR